MATVRANGGRDTAAAQAMRSATKLELSEGRKVPLLTDLDEVDEAWRHRPRARDGQGRYVSTKPENMITDAERERRRARERAITRQLSDRRTRMARRARQIERRLRALLKGRPLTIVDDFAIADAASIAIQIELMRAQQTRGHDIDLSEFTRLLNISQRLLWQLGLKPSVLNEGERAPRGRFARERWDAQEQAAQTAHRERSTRRKKDRPDARAATAE